MKEYKYHYTYLITNLKPATTQRYYIGVKSCNVLPEENIDYMGSSFILVEDIKLYGTDKFEKIVIDEFNSRDEAEAHENALHLSHNAASNLIFYNKKNGNIGFHTTLESTAKQKATINDSSWKITAGRDQSLKHSQTLNDPAWLLTKGITKQNKIKEILNDPDWKATKGKEQSRKLKETVNDPIWQLTAGKQKSNKLVKIFNDPAWVETIGQGKSLKQKKTKGSSSWKESTGQESSCKQKETKHNPKWIAANTFICPHCNRSIQGLGNVNKWHNDNCKHNTQTAK